MNFKSFLAAALSLSACRASAADWTYAGGAITDGDWTFAATVKAGTVELAVGAVLADPGSGAALDFSKPVSDGESAYTIVKLDPRFRDYGNKANLTALILPESGVGEISDNAFNGCSGLASVSPFLPDSVRTLGDGAFEGTAVEAPLSLLGAVTVGKKAFGGTQITSVTFGRALMTLKAGWGSGCFRNCPKLAAVNFDPEMTGGTISGELIFEGSVNIAGTLDLRGFTNLGAANRPWYNAASNVDRIIFSSSLSSLSTSFFNGQTKLKTIEFTGGPPDGIAAICKAWENPSLSGVATLVPFESKDAWRVYCAGGVINDLDSKWSADYVSTAESKSHYLVYKSSGGGKLGDWVFDGAELKSASQGWAFSATRSANLLTLGACTAHPDSPGALDFTTSMTDDGGAAVKVVSFSNLFHDGSACVAGFDKVTSVAMPPDSAIVGEHSFHGCSALSGALALCAGVTEIRASAFEGCTGITSVGLPSSLLLVGDRAFSGCTALASVSPYLPDSVVRIGKNAFKDVPASADVSALGVEFVDKSAFRGTGITSLRFGPALADLECGYQDGAICCNDALTNITFDAGMSQARISGEHAFYGNPNLSGTVDMRGFRLTKANGRPFDGSKVEHLIFTGAGDVIPDTVFEKMSCLADVTFTGEPPSNAENIFNNHGRPGTKLSASLDVVTYVRNACREQWAAYAEGGMLNGRNSTWARECIDSDVTDLSKRRLLIVDAPPEGTVVTVK